MRGDVRPAGRSVTSPGRGPAPPVGEVVGDPLGDVGLQVLDAHGALQDAVRTATVDRPNSCWSTPRVTSTVWMREIGTSVQVRVSQPVRV